MINGTWLAWKGVKAFARASARNNVLTAQFTRGGMQGDGGDAIETASAFLLFALLPLYLLVILYHGLVVTINAITDPISRWLWMRGCQRLKAKTFAAEAASGEECLTLRAEWRALYQRGPRYVNLPWGLER